MNEYPECAYHVYTACMWEVLARKVGNVHPRMSFSNTNYLHFLQSAMAMGMCFSQPSERTVGQLVLDSVRATQSAVQQNTNLGIILLLAPLAQAENSEQIGRVLDGLTVQDTRLVYEAIRVANPGGLGQSNEADVQAEPTVTLRAAMALAADRDLIARQYASGFAEVLNFGVERIRQNHLKLGSIEATVIDCQLAWLAHFPDSLIARKNGLPQAVEVQNRAQAVLDSGGVFTSVGRRAGRDLDAYLRTDGHRLNPGTTADLITACLVVLLRDRTLSPTAPFTWSVSDWL
jgi:triphosphoribosyl-dephospho-CoA synthase